MFFCNYELHNHHKNKNSYLLSISQWGWLMKWKIENKFNKDIVLV